MLGEKSKSDKSIGRRQCWGDEKLLEDLEDVETNRSALKAPSGWFLAREAGGVR
jgi:hypothetical protein